MANTTYITKPNERWDNVSMECYGVPHLMNEIIASNPDVPIYDVLPAGLVLQIPILPNVSSLTNTNLLPPWKR